MNSHQNYATLNIAKFIYPALKQVVALGSKAANYMSSSMIIYK